MIEVPPAISITFIVLGTIIIILNKFFGKKFSKFGKSIWNNAPNIHKELMPKFLVEYVYDEKKAPKIMVILGVVFIIQGGLLLYCHRWDKLKST